MTPDAPPFLLVHGTADWLVPYAQSEQLHAALTGAGVDCRLGRSRAPSTSSTATTTSTPSSSSPSTTWPTALR